MFGRFRCHVISADTFDMIDLCYVKSRTKSLRCHENVADTFDIIDTGL